MKGIVQYCITFLPDFISENVEIFSVFSEGVWRGRGQKVGVAKRAGVKKRRGQKRSVAQMERGQREGVANKGAWPTWGRGQKGARSAAYPISRVPSQPRTLSVAYSLCRVPSQSRTGKKAGKTRKTEKSEKTGKKREKGSQNIKACRIENTLKLVTSP
jgi:hypothetical protein